MRKLISFLLVGVLGLGMLASVLPAQAASTGNSAPHPGRIVSDNPSGFTPNVMDGAVLSLARVGDLIIVGGTFTRVRNANTSVDITRRNVFAFNATSGQVSTTFNPNPNSSVYKVLPASDGTSVYLGGDFTQITSGGSTVSVSRLVRVSATTGTRDAGFAPGSFNGSVRDLEVTGPRLWVVGKFTHLQGRPQRAMGTLNATTGAYDPFFTGVVAGAHRDGSVTNVLSIASDPTNSQLVAAGNFETVDGARREQIVKLDISGQSYALANWYTTQFESGCSSSFETYMGEVSFSPNGQFFVVPTAGGYGGSGASNAGTSGCDVVARFESNGTGTNIRPTWTTYTGGDSTWTVEVTDNVVYTGGHQRWQNNPGGSNAPGQGAVSREGIAALNAVNGMPYSWNPTRSRGVGIKDMLATEQGLFVGSDTNTFAGESHYKVAFLPLAGGQDLPEPEPYALPADVFRVGTGQSQLTRTHFDGTGITDPANVPNGPGWGNSVGAFMVDGILYTAYSNGNLTKQTFDGTAYGPATPVDTADDIVRQTDWHNTDMPSITSLFYSEGRIYFTRSGQSVLYSRGFETESDVVGQLRTTTPAVSGVSYLSMRGAFVADGLLYFANTSGTLSSATWGGTAPVAGTAQVLSGAGGGWNSRAMFVYQGDEIGPPVDQPPTADASVSCVQLACTFNGTGSTDAEGPIASYAWAFGDGNTGSGATTSHTYGSAGPRTVTLTVTDSNGATGQTTRSINPTDQAATVGFVGAASTVGNRTSHTVTIPSGVQAGDQLLLFFTGNSTTSTYTPPAGWTQQETQGGDNTSGRLYSRLATAGDAGSPVSVLSSSTVKDVTTVVAYRGGILADSSSALDANPGTTHVTPSVSATDNLGWLVSYWSDKSSTTTDWTLPGGTTQRSEAFGSPSGHITAILGDSNAPVASGSRGGLTATTNADSSADVTFSVWIR